MPRGVKRIIGLSAAADYRRIGCQCAFLVTK
jgi:hypothetical protein